MKKLTAGIFTVLIGLVSVNAANAAVASKDYVDTKAAALATAAQTAAETTAAGALSSAKTELEGKINAKVAQADYDAKVQALEAADATFATTSAMNTELAKKQNNLTVTGGVLTWDAETSTLGLTGIATSDSLDTLQNTVNTLSADVNTDGSVKKQIADAVAAEATRSDSYADQAEADAIAAAEAKVTELANGAVKDNTDAIAAINNADTGILKQAQEYADGLATNYDAAGSAAAAQAAAEAKVTELANGAVKSNTEAIAAMDTNYVSEDEMTSFKETNSEAIAAAKTQADKGVADAATAQTAAAAAKTAADAAQAAANAAQADATQALTNAAAAQSAAEAAQATANAAIPKPQGECANPTNKCVLTFNNAEYAWEVIERATGETGF